MKQFRPGRHATVRRAVAMGALSLVAATGMGAAAFACSSVASLKMSTTSGLPGSVVQVTGAGFTTGQPVTLNLKDAAGAGTTVLLAQATPDSAGRIATTFRVPAVTPGDEVVSATQTKADGSPNAATASGALFQVLGVGAPPSGTRTHTPPLAALAAIATSGVLLLGFGLARLARRSRRQPDPVGVLPSTGDLNEDQERTVAPTTSEEPVGATR